ncbi:hypothetical protein MYIN104542_27045 [Mycobacterium intermedium]
MSFVVTAPAAATAADRLRQDPHSAAPYDRDDPPAGNPRYRPPLRHAVHGRSNSRSPPNRNP